ncbi:MULTISPECIES: DUF805 domain-containing protein [unclassified Rickettsia]|uniref:DUF805 domain-containing protein n=1 Tax=unclassified Rickettsia TaxID=114295 RepID=UPI00313311A3
MIKIFINSITKKIFNFKGRSNIKEYFIFIFFEIIIVGALLLAERKYGRTDFLTLIAGIVLIVYLFANTSLTVRRLHDCNLSGFWFLLGIIFSPLIGLLLLFIKGTSGSNRYGKPPMD